MTQYSDDKLIIKNLKEGDSVSFENIFNKYNRKVYYFAFSFLKNRGEAEDVVQEVFLNLWKYRGQINEYYTFSKYLFKITFNTVCKKFRKQASCRKILEEVMQKKIFDDDSTNLNIEYNSLFETVNFLIDKMPSRQKNIFRLYINDQMTIEQIAEQLDISKKTVENYLVMAKSSLKKILSAGHILPILFFWLFLN